MQRSTGVIVAERSVRWCPVRVVCSRSWPADRNREEGAHNVVEGQPRWWYIKLGEVKARTTPSGFEQDDISGRIRPRLCT
jgi:hypothetical protein